MMTKEYMEFVEELSQKLRMALGLEEEKVRFVKCGGKHAEDGDRLMVQFGTFGTDIGMCAIHVDEAFEEYLKGQSSTDIAKELVSDITSMKASGDFEKVIESGDYGKVKDNLFIRPFSLEKDLKVLKDAIYKTVGDIALVLCLRVRDDEEGLISCSVHRDFLDKWGLDKEKVFDEAMQNTARMWPPRVYNLLRMIIDEGYEGDEISSETIMGNDPYGNCLSTRKKLNGAVSIFLPGVAEAIGEIFGEDYYAVFTSKHEVMIHSISTVKVGALSEILKNTLEADTVEEDYLTSKIYRYYSDGNCILPVEEECRAEATA